MPSESMDKLVGLALLGQIHDALKFGCDTHYCLTGSRDQPHEQGCPHALDGDQEDTE